jgi:hypothetical protein
MEFIKIEKSFNSELNLYPLSKVLIFFNFKDYISIF